MGTVIELITHLHSFSFGINLSLVSLVSEKIAQIEEHQAGCEVSAVPEDTGVGGALHKPRLSLAESSSEICPQQLKSPNYRDRNTNIDRVSELKFDRLLLNNRS